MSTNSISGVSSQALQHYAQLNSKNKVAQEPPVQQQPQNTAPAVSKESGGDKDGRTGTKIDYYA